MALADKFDPNSQALSRDALKDMFHHTQSDTHSDTKTGIFSLFKMWFDCSHHELMMALHLTICWSLNCLTSAVLERKSCGLLIHKQGLGFPKMVPLIQP